MGLSKSWLNFMHLSVYSRSSSSNSCAQRVNSSYSAIVFECLSSADAKVFWILHIILTPNKSSDEDVDELLLSDMERTRCLTLYDE